MEESEQQESVLIDIKTKAPIIWNQNANYIIQDLRENYYDEVKTLIKRQYFRDEALCRSTKLLEDYESLESFLNTIMTWIFDTMSLVALSKKSGRVIGTAITRINSDLDKTNTYSRLQILEGQALDLIMQFKNDLIKQVNAYETMGCDRYLRVYLLCVHPSYKKKSVADSLLLSCSRLASSFKIDKVAGIFTTKAEQSSAYNVGFSFLKEITYKKWIINGKVVITDPGEDNDTAIFMYKSTLIKEQ